MLKNYLKTAWRTVWKNKQVSFINMAGLSIGMTAAVFILLWVQNEMSFDSYHPQADNIYRITSILHLDKQNTWVWQTSPMLLARTAKREIPSIENIAMLQPGFQTVFNVNGHLFNEKDCAYVDKGWFSLFHYDFVKGSPENFFQNPFSILLTESAAKKYFGNQDAIGQIIRLDTVNYTVKAVIKDNPTNSSFQYQALIPVAARIANPHLMEQDESWRSSNYMIFLLLHKQVDITAVAKQLTGIMNKNNRGNNTTISLEPLKDIHFESDLQFAMPPHGNKKNVYIFAVLGILLILIACINYVNLTTARASLRSKEISIRKIVGAKRKQLFAQFMAESLVISFISILITFLLIRLLLPFFNRITGENFLFPLTSVSLWEILLGTLLLVTLLNSIYPALLLSSFKPLNIFRGISILKVKDTNFRKTLVVLQFSVSSLLIIGTIVIFTQMRFIQKSNAGYNKAQIFSLRIPFNSFDRNQEERLTAIHSLRNEILQQTSITGVSMTNQPILEMISAASGAVNWDGKDSTLNPAVTLLTADAGFRRMFHVPIESGRWFSPDNINDKHNVILNETAINQFHLRKPVIGMPFIFMGDTGQVIGVAKDFHYLSFHDKIGPMVIFNNPGWFSFIYCEAAPGKTTQALESVGRIWKKYFPDAPFDYTFLDQAFDNLYKTDRLTSKLILIFSCLAIFISCLGLLGLTAFAAEQRTKEIGIRKILGASVKDIVSLLSKDFILLVLIAFIIASPVAWWAMNKWLQNFAYRISINAWTFVAAGIVLFIMAMLTTGYYAVRTGMRNPVKNLRTE
ncbi:MAG: FtsX-like permease family protein [Chitinophagaceae bacterium]|nr:MAG: FtsX-like permease family protein [Chitinophagaceae bacterium]